MDPKGVLAGVVVAIGLCLANTVVGYIIARKAFRRELNVFLGMVFGSMAARLAVVVVVVWALISEVGLHQLAFSLTFVIGGFIMIIGEVLFFHTSYERKKYRTRRPVTELLKKKPDLFQFVRHQDLLIA